MAACPIFSALQYTARVQSLVYGETWISRTWIDGLPDGPQSSEGGSRSRAVVTHGQQSQTACGRSGRKGLRKPGGCILWLEFDPESLAIERYYWFGSKAGNALPDLGERISRHSKGNSEGEKNERPIHRVLTRGRFEALADIGEVAEKLFG